MRIAHIEAGRHLYGGGRQVRYLIDGLAARGIDNVLICARGGELAAAPPRAEVVPVTIGGDLDLGLWRRLRRALAHGRPDLVHVHSRRGAELYGGLASAAERRPAVLTRRVDSAEPRVWARLKYRPYSALIALSGAIERQLIEAGVDAGFVHRIPSAVDTERYRPAPGARERLLGEFDLPADALVVGVVAQLIPRKRHRWLLAELPELVRRRPEIRVLAFGRGPLAAALNEAVASAGLERHVQLAGFRDDLPQLLPGLDLLVHPAEREGLGVALLEASSCALPVVACAVGGIVDVVDHERTGVLVPAREQGSLAHAIERLAADPVERRTFGAAGRRAMQERFSVRALVEAHERLYSAVLTGSKRRAVSAATRPAVGSGASK